MSRPTKFNEMRSYGWKSTHRATFPTSLSIFHLALRLFLYSIAALSLAVTTPSFSEAFAFQIRTLPSSEPDRTNRASDVNMDDDTLSTISISVKSEVARWITFASVLYDKLHSHSHSPPSKSLPSDPIPRSQTLPPSDSNRNSSQLPHALYKCTSAGSCSLHRTCIGYDLRKRGGASLGMLGTMRVRWNGIGGWNDERRRMFGCRRE